MKIAYDATLCKPACPILEAAMGADKFSHLFPAESWLTAPTSNLRVYEITREQLLVLIQRVKTGWHGFQPQD